MKKIALVLTLAIVSLSAYSQAGGLSVGVRGAYLTHYETPHYGIDVSYHLSNSIELSLSQLISPSLTLKDKDLGTKEKLGLYSTSLDIRYYMIQQDSWGTGPSIGGQFLYIKDREVSTFDEKMAAFNIGWHIRGNLTENIKLNGGWRYTNGKDETRYHSFYLGVCYTFELF